MVVAVETGSRPCLADAVDNYLRAEMDHHQIPGAELLVLRDGKALKQGSYGYANVELKAPVETDTVFEIGSITKQFTAVAILLLEQENKLSVKDTLGKHLGEIPDAWASVTITHLLTHTSGIKSYTGLDGFELRRHLTQKEFIRSIGTYPLEFEPGSAWKYSNTGYSLLGYIIENVSGKSYWDFMGDRIFGPLGLRATTNRAPGNIIPHRASGYEQTNHVWINRDYDLTDVFSAGAIVSTAPDLSKWLAGLDGNSLLNSQSRNSSWTPFVLKDGTPTRYGFGWFIDTLEGHRIVGHGGATSGFSASIQRFPDDHLDVILLTNTDEQIATRLARAIGMFYLGSPFKPSDQ